MNLYDDPDPIATQVTLERWTAYAADPRLSIAEKRAAISTDLPELRATATWLRVLAAKVAEPDSAVQVAAQASVDKVEAYVRNRALVQVNRDRAFAAGNPAVERRIEIRKASEDLDLARREYAKAEEAWARVRTSDMPEADKLQTEAGVELRRQRVDRCERALAAAQARM